MKNYLLTIVFVFFIYSLFADGILENFETGIQDPFNGSSSLTWIGDVGGFEISTAGWPWGSSVDFTDSYAIRSLGGVSHNSTILTDISLVYSSSQKMRWEVYMSGNSADITTGRGSAFILLVNSNNIDAVEGGIVNGYRIRLCDPSSSSGWEDGLYFEKANGSEWVMIDSIHRSSANINQGWNIVAERDVNGTWSWGFTNGTIGETVSLTKSFTDNTYSTGSYSGIYWYSSTTSAGNFGFDNFKVDPYTPNLWRGEAGSTDWLTASNWDDGVVPNTTADIQIEAGVNQPNIIDNTSCNNLVLEAGANLTVSPEVVLSVNGNLRLQSDASGTASIIDHGTLAVSGTSSIERYMQCFDPNANDEYHFLSIPIADHNVENSLQNYYVYPYNEAQNAWTSLSSGDQLLKGKGYSVYYSGDANHCVAFSGIPNTGDQIIPITANNYSGSLPSDNWNLIGNPFPSPIDWDLVSYDNIEGAIYIWKAETCTYASYVSGTGTNFNDDGIIPSMQGFFVHATSFGNLTIPQSTRVHNQTQDYLMKNLASYPKLKIKIKNQTYSDECVIRLKSGATESWDKDFDALKFLSGKQEVPQIFSLINHELQASINSLPEQLDQYEIPIFTKVDHDGMYEIYISNVSTLIQDYDIVLQNNINGDSYEIEKDSCFQLDLSAGEIEHFTLFIAHKKTTVQEVDEDISISILADGKIEIANISPSFIGGEMRLVSINGKMLCSQKINNESMKLSTNHRGVFILQLKSKQNLLTRKIIII